MRREFEFWYPFDLRVRRRAFQVSWTVCRASPVRALEAAGCATGVRSEGIAAAAETCRELSMLVSGQTVLACVSMMLGFPTVPALGHASHMRAVHYGTQLARWGFYASGHTDGADTLHAQVSGKDLINNHLTYMPCRVASQWPART